MHGHPLNRWLRNINQKLTSKDTFTVVQHKIFAIKMSGKGSGKCGYQGREGRWGWGGLSRGISAIGYSYSGATTKHKGIYSALGIHVFDYGHKESADKMRNTWENIVHHGGTIDGHDIRNWLFNKKIVSIAKNQAHSRCIGWRSINH